MKMIIKTTEIIYIQVDAPSTDITLHAMHTSTRTGEMKASVYFV